MIKRNRKQNNKDNSIMRLEGKTVFYKIEKKAEHKCTSLIVQ